MIGFALAFSFIALGIATLLALWRLVFAPGFGDRVLALDTMVINALGLIVCYNIAQNTQIYFEAAMIIAMLGYVSTVAYARFVLRGNVIE